MVRLWAVVGMLCLACCAQAQEGVPPQTQPVTLSPKQIAEVKSIITDLLKDPESVRFNKPFRAAKASDGAIMVCGLVNAKNSYGGYTGNSYFIGVFSVSANKFVLNRVSSNRDEYAEAQRVCAAVGIAAD